MGDDVQQRDRFDTFGALALIGFSAFLGLGQVVVKLVNQGLQPVFGVAMGTLLLDEPLPPGLLVGLGLVVFGLILVNRTPRPR